MFMTGLPSHLLYPPTRPTICPAAASVNLLFRREIPRRWSYGGQWYWLGKGNAGADWHKYSPAANSDIELSFMRGEESRTVSICEQGQDPSQAKAKQRHVCINFNGMAQSNLSRKGASFPIKRWPDTSFVPPSLREPVCHVEVEGHGAIFWYPYESPVDAVDRFYRNSHPPVPIQARLQIYLFLESLVETQIRRDEVAAAILEYEEQHAEGTQLHNTTWGTEPPDVVMSRLNADFNSHRFTTISKVTPKKDGRAH